MRRIDEEMAGGEDGDGEPTLMPANTEELRLAIANTDFGVSNNRFSTWASPAMKAYNGTAIDSDKVEHMRGQPLPEGFKFVKARLTPPNCESTVSQFT